MSVKAILIGAAVGVVAAYLLRKTSVPAAPEMAARVRGM